MKNLPVMKNLPICIAVALLITESSFAQNGEREWGPIQDNSFLLEEAYNQEYGVVQHISGYRLFQDTGWTYTFTQEWPVPGQKHQLSYTVPILNVDSVGGEETGFSDIALNYRYQLIGNGDVKLAIAPRFSVLLPTGNELKSLGKGGSGFQFNFPASIVLNSQFVSHWNAGFTHFLSAKNEKGVETDSTDF